MIAPYYKAAGIEIYHGDCREILPSGDHTTVGGQRFGVGTQGTQSCVKLTDVRCEFCRIRESGDGCHTQTGYCRAIKAIYV